MTKSSWYSNTTDCRSCHGLIAQHIKLCPHCGESYPDQWDVRKKIRMAFGVIPIFGASQRTEDERAEKENNTTQEQTDNQSSDFKSFMASVALGLIVLGVKKILEKKTS
ncbi:MAG: hypothetical protein WBE39_00860 [Candidatus Competibacter sp.]